MGPPALTEPAVHLRPARLADARLLFRWRNDPRTVATSISQNQVAWDEHVDWLRRKIADDAWRGWVALDADGDAIGLARFQREDESAWNIGVVIAPQRRGERLAPVVIREGCRRLTGLSDAALKVVAVIRHDNIASIRSFERAGFRHDSTGDSAEATRYVWTARRT